MVPFLLSTATKDIFGKVDNVSISMNARTKMEVVPITATTCKEVTRVHVMLDTLWGLMVSLVRI